MAGSKDLGEAGIQITWDNPGELEKYIGKLQSAAEKLTSENRRLRKSHSIVCEKVIASQNKTHSYSLSHSCDYIKLSYD